MRFIAKRIKSLSAAFMAAAVVLTALLLTALPAYADTAAGTEKVGLNIRITGNVMGPLAYNAKERSVSGFTAEYQVGSGEWTTTAPAGVTVELKDGVIAEASGTDAGVYIMGLSEASFDIAAQGYTLGHITVTDGSLEITKAGLKVAVNDQSYVYDGQPHGEGDTAYEDPAEIAEKVTVSGLQGDDAVASLILDGAETGINVYENRIEITGLSILNNGADVKDNYDITLIKGKLTITKPPTPSEYYDIYIANVRLNNLNAGDLSVIDGVDVVAGGEASFDPETNTLTLADVSINGPGRYTDNNYSNIAVSSGIQTLTIIFRGENSVSAEGISSNCNAMNCLNTDVIMEGEDDAVMNFKARFNSPPAENGAVRCKTFTVNGGTVNCIAPESRHTGNGYWNNPYGITLNARRGDLLRVDGGKLVCKAFAPVIAEKLEGRVAAGTVLQGSASYDGTGLAAYDYSTNGYYGSDGRFKGTYRYVEAAAGETSAVTVTAGDINEGENETVTVELKPSDAAGKVTLTITGPDGGSNRYDIDITENMGGKGSMTLPAPAAGTYHVKADYSGGGKYIPASGETTFTVTPLPVLGIGITGSSGTFAYNASKQSVSGYSVKYKVGEADWTENAPDGVAVTLKEGVTAAAEATNVGTWPMGLGDASFDIAAKGYTLGQVTVSDGSLEITKAALTVAVNDQSYVYNGQPHGEGDTAYEDPAEIAEKITVSGLQGDDLIASLVLDGAETEIKVYENRIEITGLSILNNGADVKGNYDITLVAGKLTIAEKQPETFTVSFDANGGSGRMKDVTVEAGEYTLPECTFTAPEDKAFDGWLAGSDTYDPGDKITVEADTTVTAQWKDVPPVHVHTLELKEAKQVGCTEEGNTAYYVCTGCGRWFEDATALAEITDKSSVIIKPTGHSWDEGVVTKEPTYTSEGVRTYTCLHNSSHTKEEAIPKKKRRSSSGSSESGSGSSVSRSTGGSWSLDASGWHYKENGVLLKNTWKYLPYNGVSYWYYFDESGTMKTGWSDQNGNRYYLYPVSDGWMGRMVTGWQKIEGKWYYFETAAGKDQGRMYRSERTPDGYYVGPDGAWDGNPADQGA